MSGNIVNLFRSANEAQTIGNKNPVNMLASDKLLAAASPGSFSLVDNTNINNKASDAAAASCRSYNDIAGLRRLQKDQINTTYYESKCGWRYRPSTGLVPEINKAALGTAAGPIFGQAGSPDEVVGGTQWFWDLDDAEQKISTQICKNASKCKQLSMLGKYADICGYCKSTGAIIPIVGGAARFNNANSGCLKKDIVTAATSAKNCPAGEGFTSFRQGDLNQVFKVREGFANLDKLNNCMEMPLSRDCVILAAQNAGCSPDGTLIRALQGSTGNYDSKLTTNSAYNSYNSFMPFSAGLMQDGSVASINVALNDFNRLMQDTQSTKEKVGLAARDLCIRAGEFDKYDFCREMGLATIINANNIACVQKVWKQNGGTDKGTGAPTLAKWNGKRFEEFLLNGITTLLNVNYSTKKSVNASGLMSMVGTESFTNNVSELPPIENTRGAETVWFDLGDVRNPNANIVILKCDLRLRKDTSTRAGPAGEVLPFITTWTDMTNKYNFVTYSNVHEYANARNNKAYTSAFEIRTPADENYVSFEITTDDGFMISKNKNPFENAGGGPDWGSWRYQGPTKYNSGNYSLSQTDTNIFVTKWFQGYGEATSKFFMYRPKTGWVRGADSPDIYLTQEPLAPWCQYELCSRQNNGAGKTVGLFEKRWNGPSALNQEQRPTPGFDVISGNIAFQTNVKLRESVPGKKGYASFLSNSYWGTNAYFHFNSFRTITILIRPSAELARGESASIFHHCNFSGYSAGMYLTNNGGKYSISYGTSQGQFQTQHPVAMNEWNLIVIQYVGNDNGITRITCNVENLSNIQTDSGRASFFAKLNAGRISGTSVVIGNPNQDPFPNSGMLIIGALNNKIYKNCRITSPSFKGDVAWIHGFRNYLDTDDLLKKEVTQEWISRWPVPNLA